MLADNPILEKRTSRSSMDLGHWFEACWMPDHFADFATASRIMIFTRISRRPTMYTRLFEYQNSDWEVEEMKNRGSNPRTDLSCIPRFLLPWERDRGN